MHADPWAAGTPGTGESGEPGFVLRRLQVYNWGPFGGLHDARLDPRGTAIIGPTGSGKTTLVDALMTLLSAQPRYNLASTGGHESDRDLMSYLRGVSGPGTGAEGDGSHVARPGKTHTGIAATLSSGTRQIQLLGLFWTAGPGMAAADRQDFWLFVQQAEPLPLEHWLTLLHEEGLRALKQEARATEGVQPFDTKKAYLAQLRRFFAVSDNAFNLLNRAAGLKQLNSIDEIFRDLVLDDRAFHGAAAEVVREFDTLAGIHTELQRAREQRDALAPLARSERLHREAQARHALEQRRLAALPGWFALASLRIWGAQHAQLLARQDQWNTEKQALGTQIQQRESQLDQLREQYQREGGGSLDDKKKLMAQHRQTAARVRAAAQDYDRAARQLQLAPAPDARAFAANLEQLAGGQAEAEALAGQLADKAYEAGSVVREHDQALQGLRSDVAQIRQRPHSNIPPAFQAWREALAHALGEAPEDIPFVAELVEVPPPEGRWRGAIERALGPDRLRLLVPAGAMDEALRWVNGRDNRLHVRLQDTRQTQHAGPRGAAPFADGFVRRLRIKPHPLQAALQALLVQRDRHCVDSPERLRTTPHAMTAEGLMSDAADRFDKQDQKPLGEGWLTGFDNRDQLSTLEAEAKARQAARDTAQQDFLRAQQAHEAQRQNLLLRERLRNLPFADIDVAGAEAQMQSLQGQIDALERADSPLAQLQAQVAVLSQAIQALRGDLSALDQRIGTLEPQLTQAHAALAQARQLAPALGLEAFDREIVAGLPGLEAAQAAELAALQRDAQQVLHQAAEAAQAELSSLAQQLVRQMSQARRVDTGELADAGTDLFDLPAYLERLRVLEHEALPEKQQRFQAYLNQSSEQGINQLLSDVDNEVSAIEDRIEDLNLTLARVEFQPGAHLQLVTRRIAHQSLRDLQTAQRALRAAALKSTEDGGEAHYQALQEVVRQLRQAADNRRTQAARAMLDPRWRLDFSVSLIEQATGRLLQSRKSSQGGSGGEKEIIASYILTASLSYALAPEGSARPRFATVVLDEAFSRTSQAVAARIVAALRAFGLNPLFVTPNKELRLLREHTRQAIVVNRRGTQSRLLSLRWEELDAHLHDGATSGAIAKPPAQAGRGGCA